MSEAQRQAIYTDSNWQGGNYTPDTAPNQGLALARMMAMITDRYWESFTNRFGRQQDESNQFAMASYLHYQGQKLIERFDANTYITLTHAMDSHDVGWNRKDYQSALQSIKQPALVVSIDSDVLYPPVEQQELVDLIPHAQLGLLKSPHGHDAFLIDMEELNDMIVFLRKEKTNAN